MIAASLTRLGFDQARLTFTLRTAAASALALVVAWALGLEHPQWSAMTVWAATQPLRGQLLEKSLFRFAGTVIGSLFGIALMAASGGAPWAIVTGLTLWIGLCAGLGNVVRGLAAYGVILAGYSAAMVVLLDTSHPQHILVLGLDRMMTVLVGAITALAVGWLFAATSPEQDLFGRVHRLTARSLRDLAAQLAGSLVLTGPELRRLLADMALVEEGLDAHAAGSLRSRQNVRAIRRVLIALVAVLLWMRRQSPASCARADLALVLEQAADHVEHGHADGQVAALRQAAALVADDPSLRPVIEGLVHALPAEAEADGDERATAPILHRDWVGAREATVRAMATMALVGLTWLVTGVELGPFMLLGTAVMTSLFSTFDNPAHMMRHVFWGQIVGGIAALSVRWLVWPLAGNQADLVVMIMPFLIPGAFLMAHPRTMLMGMDYNMVLLLLSKPEWPLTGSFGQSLTQTAAVCAGPLIALAAFRLLYPIDSKRRLRILIRMMVDEVAAMATRPKAAAQRPMWRARLYHRVLRLVRWVEKTGTNEVRAVDGGLAVLTLGSAVLHLHDLLARDAGDGGSDRRVRAALERVGRVEQDPVRAARTLRAVARGLDGRIGADSGLIRAAAAGIDANPAIFSR